MPIERLIVNAAGDQCSPPPLTRMRSMSMPTGTRHDFSAFAHRQADSRLDAMSLGIRQREQALRHAECAEREIEQGRIAGTGSAQPLARAFSSYPDEEERDRRRRAPYHEAAGRLQNAGLAPLAPPWQSAPFGSGRDDVALPPCNGPTGEPSYAPRPRRLSSRPPHFQRRGLRASQSEELLRLRRRNEQLRLDRERTDAEAALDQARIVRLQAQQLAREAALTQRASPLPAYHRT
jgi:hypothetical protein